MALTLFTIFISPLSFAATLNSISQKQFQTAFVNKTAATIGEEKLNGNPINNPFAIYMDDHGKIWARMAYKPTSAPQEDEGTYTIGKDGTLYLQWNHWFKSKKLCARFYDAKNAYIVLGCDGTFQTIFMKDAIMAGKQF